jgi:hypothetical protein
MGASLFALYLSTDTRKRPEDPSEASFFVTTLYAAGRPDGRLRFPSHLYPPSERIFHNVRVELWKQRTTRDGHPGSFHVSLDRSDCGFDNHASTGLTAYRPAVDTLNARNEIMNGLALEDVHRLEADGATILQDLIHNLVSLI